LLILSHELSDDVVESLFDIDIVFGGRFQKVAPELFPERFAFPYGYFSIAYKVAFVSHKNHWSMIGQDRVNRVLARD
jgi:hypothetical protein